MNNGEQMIGIRWNRMILDSNKQAFVRKYGIHIFSNLKISNENILKNILEIQDQNRISI